MEERHYTQRRGTTWNGLQATITRNGAPPPLTGATITMTMKRRGAMRSATPALSLTSTAGQILITGPTTFTISPVIINASAGLYDWECDTLLATGEKKTWLGGTFTMEDDLG
jgi:hypothetical protein